MRTAKQLTEPQRSSLRHAKKLQREGSLWCGHPQRVAMFCAMGLMEFVEICEHEDTGRQVRGYKLTAKGEALLERSTMPNPRHRRRRR